MQLCVAFIRLVSTTAVRIACHHLEQSLGRCRLADGTLLLNIVR